MPSSPPAMAWYHGSMQSIHAELMRKLKVFSHDENERLPDIRRLLEQGADPNQVERSHHHFVCAVGIAAAQAWPTVVETLLAAGGQPVWPTPETEIPNEDLVGHTRDEAYKGPPCDPLVYTMEKLAWRMVEYDPQDHDKVGETLRYHAIAKILMAAGAPADRTDPANCRAPVDHLLLILVENSGGETLHPSCVRMVSELILCAIDQSGDRMHYLQEIAKGNLTTLPFAQWEWHEDHPEIIPVVMAHAQQHLLQSTTPVQPGKRSTARL
jgi:hypothetical protein